jgi:sterol desaturase/sphingolipid hydroxylase (fatty acid hydroxylase superfamily)
MTTSATMAGIVTAMALLAGIEAAVPLHVRGGWNRRHLRPNLALTGITFGINAVLNVAMAMALAWQAEHRIGLLHADAVSPLVATAVVVLVLDFATYLAHVSMHVVPVLWRFHRVHHSDPAVDVTTTIRQHPGEGLIRYLFLAGAACGVGAGPGAFALYRMWSVLNGLVEHANIRVPPLLDALASWVVTTPNMHKVHHSRRAEETNSNYGNIFSLFDRCLATYTPSRRGLHVTYGLDELDAPTVQTTAGLLALPFRRVVPARVHDRR